MPIVSCSQLPLKSFAKIMTYGRGKQCSSLNRLITSGNIKIPRTTAIFNMSSATDCPARKLGLCAAAKAGVKCYAMKAEATFYHEPLPHRRAQEAYWLNVSANEFVAQFILLNALKERPFTRIRFNEAGDFHRQECVDKAEEIAKKLRRFGIRCYGYTSRSDLDYSRVRHLILSGSGFTKQGITNEFRIVRDLKDRPKGFGVCKGNCRVCNRCTLHNMKTVVKSH